MAQNVTLYNLLISCPGDIKEEVTLIESAVDEFNELYAETLGITIKTRHWSKSSKQKGYMFRHTGQMHIQYDLPLLQYS